MPPKRTLRIKTPVQYNPVMATGIPHPQSNTSHLQSSGVKTARESLLKILEHGPVCFGRLHAVCRLTCRLLQSSSLHPDIYTRLEDWVRVYNQLQGLAAEDTPWTMALSWESNCRRDPASVYAWYKVIYNIPASSQLRFKSYLVPVPGSEKTSRIPLQYIMVFRAVKSEACLSHTEHLSEPQAYSQAMVFSY